MSTTYDAGLGWTVLADTSPAVAPVDVRLPGLVLTFDAAGDLIRPIRVVIDEGSARGQIASDARTTAMRLFGEAPEGLLLHGTPPAIGPGAEAIRAVVDGEQLRLHGASPRLAAMVSASGFAELEDRASADDFAAVSAPALLALARYVAERSGFLRKIPVELRALLTDQLGVTQESEVVQSHPRQVDMLLDLRAALTGAEFDRDLAALLDGTAPFAPAYAAKVQPTSVVSINQRWSTADLYVGLGELGEQFFEGVPLHGTVPGTLSGNFWLRRGAETLLRNVVARIYTWEGVFVAESPVAIRSGGVMPRARIRFELTEPVDSVLARDAGVYLEVTTSDQPRALPQSVRSFAERRASRLAGEALELRRMRAVDAASDAWNEASLMRFVLSGSAVTPSVPQAVASPGDGVRTLVAAWLEDARSVLEADHGHEDDSDRLESVALVMRELGEALVPTEELATAYEEYARLLSRVEGPSAGDAYRIEAAQLRYLLHDSDGAIRVLESISHEDDDGD